jgi:hypothetical protein
MLAGRRGGYGLARLPIFGALATAAITRPDAAPLDIVPTPADGTAALKPRPGLPAGAPVGSPPRHTSQIGPICGPACREYGPC